MSSWGIKIRHPLELYIEMGNNMPDIFISSWRIKICHPLELYIEMGNSMSDIFIPVVPHKAVAEVSKIGNQ